MFKRIAVALIAFFALITMYGFADHYGSRYTSWRALSSEHVFDAAQEYIEWQYVNRKQFKNRETDNVSNITAVCFYAVTCDDDEARLALISDPDQFDFDALKRRIWARRFKGTCQGQTANLGLHVLHSQGSDRPGRDLAIWNFYGDSFTKTGDRHWFIGGAFSDEPWERCSLDRAAYLIENGALVRNPK
ncbi:MAG: hypothetical protein VXY73_05870 [Pseudomonadota bacterium]|jgi:hypothetical protein|nr:hypothetical protein [Pseudomonadota bacterium]